MQTGYWLSLQNNHEGELAISTEIDTDTAQDGASGNISWLTLGLSGGGLILFVLAALINTDWLASTVQATAGWSTKYFGAYWQILLSLTFFIGLGVGLCPWGRVRLGNRDKPDIGTPQWLSMIMCTLLAGGGVFFAAAEPMAHFVSPPPIFPSVEALSPGAVEPALAQSFMHWGFYSWAILGSLTTIVFMHTHYNLGLPLKPRALLQPVLGNWAMKSPLGDVTDAACSLAIVAGTVGPIGFVGLQVSYGLAELYGTPDTFFTQAGIILALILIYTISSASGISRGIQVLSVINISIALLLMAFILIAGPRDFIIVNYIKSAALHVKTLLPMSFYRGDAAWLDAWTVFFWGWFLGFGPLMAMFIARISNGRTIREIVLGVSICAPIVTTFWFTIVGGSGLAFELAVPGSVSGPFEGFNMPAALLAITQQLPLGQIISVLFLALTFLFVATTGDSMSYTISMVNTGTDTPPAILRIFWGAMMGVVAIILISIGNGGITALQNFIVVTAVPVSLVLLPSLWTAPRLARQLYQESTFKSRGKEAE